MWFKLNAAVFCYLFPIMIFGAGNNAQLDSGMTNPGYEEKPDWFKLSLLDIREDISEAAEDKKRVILYFYQDGCPYCKKLLQDNFGQKQIADYTQKHFELIAINMWGSKEVINLMGKTISEKSFATEFKVNFTPTLLFLNEKGKVILRVNGYYFPGKLTQVLKYIAGKNETKISFRDYYKNNLPKTASAKMHYTSGILKPPYDLKKILKQGKPLLVLFEQPSCKVCDELHNDIFQRKITKAELSHLNVVLVDTWSNDKIVDPTGKATTVSKWAQKIKVKYSPSMVFFNTQGEEVFRTEAYLKAFHVQGSMAYVHEKAYLKQPSFQRYLQERRAKIEKKGGNIDLWK